MDDRFRSIPVHPSEITPKEVFLSRRDFLRAAGILSGAALLAACAPSAVEENAAAPTGTPTPRPDVPNTYEQITNYNNYYEFSTDKQRVADLARNLRISPWTVEVGGLVRNPKTYGVEDLIRRFPPQERIYRLRCVEAWSMVIPWNGFPLADLLREADPLSEAKYVRFEALYDPEQMPGQRASFYPWPYQEGLRLDEAMHDLTLMATGLYGELLPPQNGAGIRLVVPWKYGFKSIKAVTKIELVAEQPATLWSTIAPHEYGFYANVNPEVDHPRWSQKTERRIGEAGRRPTLMFNGYAGEVAHLYAGMDLSKYY